MANHIAAIHVLKSKLQLSDDDYRALLKGLTDKSSSKDMADRDLQKVRDHLQALAVRMGVAKPSTRGAAPRSFAAKKAEASPRERKVWALWNQLGRDGVVHNPTAAALYAWMRDYMGMGVDALRFCTTAQLDTLIEGLKEWQKRGDHHG